MKIQLSEDHPEWSKVDYRMQIVTGKANVKVIGMWKYGQVENKGYEGIINITDFSKDYQRRVVDKSVPLEDLIIYCGHVNLHSYVNEPYKIFSFFLCSVDLGKISHRDEVKPTSNSIIIPPENDDALQYNFYLREYSQYNILYEVTFTISDHKDFKLSDFQCSSCQNRTPTLFCKNQSLFFCEDCGSEHHKTKLMSTHQIEHVDKINTLGLCKNHNQKLQYFCLKCQKYLCNICTQKGFHHQNHEHPIKPITYFYQQCRQNLEILPKKQKEKMQSLFLNLQAKRRQVEKNYLQSKEQIEKSYNQIMKELEALTNQKMQLLQSCELQIRMIYDKLQWGKAFCKYQDKALKPLHFFQSSLKFEEEVKKIKIPDFQIIYRIKPDIQIEGKLQIGTREFFDKRKMQQNSIIESYRNNQNEQLKSVRKIAQENIYAYNPDATPYKKGDLPLRIQSANLKFFRMKAS